MEFLKDFGLFSLIIVLVTAFLGIISTKIAEGFGGKKGKEAFERNTSTKQGWKKVGHKPNS